MENATATGEQLRFFGDPHANAEDMLPDVEDVRREADELLVSYSSGSDTERRYCRIVLPQLTNWLPEGDPPKGKVDLAA